MNLAALYRKGELHFEHLKVLVGDDESSVLFRLKERCHAQFRTEHEDLALAVHREALFDLAVGSLFHEAMKFRESFYQREMYGPKVRALRSSAGEEAAVSLFVEFERILSGVSRRLEEGLHEVEVLLEQTVQQLRVLLLLHRENGFVARFLIENAKVAEEVFGVPFFAFLAEIYGSPAEGYRTAGRSYLMSGYYGAAISALQEVSERGGDRAECARLSAYACGMGAYLSRDYAKSVEHLAKWAESLEDDPPELRSLARDAVSRVGQLAEGADRERIEAAARALLERLGEKPPVPSAS